MPLRSFQRNRRVSMRFVYSYSGRRGNNVNIKFEQVAQFKKVSIDRFYQDSVTHGFFTKETPKDIIFSTWDKIQLPKRATVGSAGYDFCTPFGFCLRANQTITIPTGIRIQMDPNYFLMILPRSGLSFKYGTRLENTASVIDSDYYFSDNEGHIFVRLTCSNNFALTAGDRFAQGILLSYGITVDDNAKEVRNGGLGSTGVSS